MTESNKIRLTVDELRQFTNGKIKVMSGFNDKVLCRDYKSNKHYGPIGLREVLSVWSEIETSTNSAFGNVIDGLDCLVVGHTHKGTVTRPSKIVVDPHNNRVSVKPYLVISMVSWLDFGGYALKKMLLPSSTEEPQRLKLGNGKTKKIEVIW